MTEEMKVQEQLSPIARRAIGKELRKRVPRSSHGKWALEANRLDPIELRQVQDKNRLQHLLPIKYGHILSGLWSLPGLSGCEHR